jgi:hypothetical protein
VQGTFNRWREGSALAAPLSSWLGDDAVEEEDQSTSRIIDSPSETRLMIFHSNELLERRAIMGAEII